MLRKAIVGSLIVVSLTGCLGNNALRAKTMKFNLSAVENRWGREFLFIGMFPVHLICGVADMLVFNSWEFWSGSNPINGKSPLVDIPKSEVDKLGIEHVEVARIERIDENEASLYVELANGDRITFDVVRERDTYTVSYRGVQFYRGQLKL